MTTVARRPLLLGGASALAATVAGTVAGAAASAAGIETRTGLHAALDRYAATRVGTIGLTLRDNRDGR